MSNTRPWYTIDELSEWIDKYQNQEWRNAAIMLGEKLSSVGPVGYYEMDAKDWLDWAMENVQPAQIAVNPEYVAFMDVPFKHWVGLTDEEIDQGLLRSNYAMQTAGAWRDGVEWATKQLKEKNT